MKINHITPGGKSGCDFFDSYMHPKILIGTLTSSKKDYCFLNWFINTINLKYEPGFDLFISDNSADRKYQDKLRLYTFGHPSVTIKRIDPKERPSIEYMADSHNQIREFFLKGDYDYLLHLESDIFPPADVIERLLHHKKDVISGLYFIGEGAKSNLWVTQLEPYSLYEQRALPLKPGADIKFIDGTVKEVYESGLGCTLISRKILEKIKFRTEKGQNVHPDTWFYADLNEAGIKAFADTSLLCVHQNSSWESNPDFVKV